MGEGEPEASHYELGPPQTQPHVSPSQCHTPHRGACSNLVSRSPPALPPGQRQEMAQRPLLPSFNSTVMSLFASLLLEPHPSCSHAHTSCIQRGSATPGCTSKEGGGEACTASGGTPWRGRVGRTGTLGHGGLRASSGAATEPPSRCPHTDPGPSLMAASGRGEPQAPEPRKRCHLYPSGPSTGRVLPRPQENRQGAVWGLQAPRAAPQCHILSSQLPLLSVQASPDPGS